MQGSEIYQFVGVLASAMAWLAIAVVLTKWPTERSKSISKHVSAYRRAWLFFAPVETLALVLFYIFMQKWFIPVLGLGTAFNIIVTLSLGLELITSWVPDTTGTKMRIHHYTAYSAVFLAPILNILIVLSPMANMATKVAAAISIAVMAVIIYLYSTVKSTRQNHLIYQSIYFACFHIPILTAIFTMAR